MIIARPASFKPYHAISHAFNWLAPRTSFPPGIFELFFKRAEAARAKLISRLLLF
jgi:hypothetical protein